MTLTLIIGLAMTAIALAFAGRRALYLYRLITHGQPAPDRVAGVTGRVGRAVKTQLVEVFGQRKLLKWSVPGAAHFFVFWAFVILGSVYVEAYGALFDHDFHIPLIGEWEVLGFAQDFIAVMCLLGIITFAVLRIQQSPQRLGRRSRFSRSHTGGAWLVLFMIFNVLWTLFFFRSAASALGNLPYDSGAFVSIALGDLIDGLPSGTLEVMERVGLLLHIGVMLVFLIDVLHSKHLHIFLAPLNVLFKRQPVALGAAKPLMNAGRPVTLDDIDDLDEDDTLGVGAIEDFSWKGMLDFNTCTECGRCQDQCPAWNTEKPLSPKLLIMALRDHAMAKGPYSLASEDKRAAMLEGSDTLVKETERPLVGDTGDDWFYMPDNGSGVIDPDVLWSCVTCGACVQQCPVDIEHVDHIVDMRRYQVLVESNFPAELNQLFKGMENKGNPWNLSSSARLDWAKDLPFEVKVVGDSIDSLDEVDWLFWVGCAGAYEDRAKKTTRAVAELLDLAGVSFGVLGNGETCTGDSARRAGNEFLFQGLAQQNVETFKEHKVKKVVSTCAHCFNTLKNEYREFGIELEVVHHTQLLNRLVREGKLTPVADGAGAAKRTITYHDPCYIGRHNQVYEPPRELLQVMPGAEFTEMPRNSERSFCCGAGGARMWMEENLGSRINVNRTQEAVATGADQIAVGCPFCRVMLSDGLTAEQADGNAREEVEVLDVAQMLLASVKGEPATKARKAASNGAPAAAPAAPEGDEARRAEPEPGDATQTSETVTETSEVGPAAKASGGESSLFDVEEDADQAAAPVEAKPEPAAEKPAQAGGSLFDIGDETPESEEPAKVEAAAAEDKAEPAPAAEPEAGLAGGGSLFDIEETTDEESAPEPTEESTTSEPAAASPEPTADATETETESASTAETEIPEGGSLFDIGGDTGEPAAGAPPKEPEQQEPATEAEEPPTGGAALSQAATAAAGDEQANGSEESAPADASEPEASEAGSSEEDGVVPAQKKPAASGESHQPKTDVDIDESGSLFDL
ncbi:MAG TPA: heterodisulfide reductase-related iron-sulfur binding cluster [Nocardioides sp.]|nr:heterodisulfide reductase-related iron-sulfur binding cluster [Nocardioides sp.]